MNEFWLWVQVTFNNREIATGFWSLIAIIFILYHGDVRSGIWNIFKILLGRKMLILFGSFSVNIAVLIWFFSSIGLWTFDQLPSTALWLFLSGFALTGRAVQAKAEDEQYFKAILLDSFRIMGIFEFLVVAYSFSLPIEIVLVPFMTFAGLMIGFSDNIKEYASVRRFFEWVVFAVVVTVLWKSIGNIWKYPDAFFSTQTGRSFLLPIILSTSSIPFLYFWYCYSHIEGALIQINVKTYHSDGLKRYARKQFILSFMHKPRLLRRATRQFHIVSTTTNSDVDQIVSDILEYERYSGSPPDVDQNLGWSPYLSRDFLKAEGLRTSDYHRSQGGAEWWATSDLIDLDSEVGSNKVTFYVKGLQGLATTLKIKGFFHGHSPSAKERFSEIAQILLRKSVSGSLRDVQNAIKSNKDFNLDIETTKVARRTEVYPNQMGFELNFVIFRGNVLDSEQFIVSGNPFDTRL